MPKFTYKRGKDTIILNRKDRKTADRALELLCEFDYPSFVLVVPEVKFFYMPLSILTKNTCMGLKGDITTCAFKVYSTKKEAEDYIKANLKEDKKFGFNCYRYGILTFKVES